MTVVAIDVSSHQPADLSNLIAQFQPQHVITKVYLPQELGDGGGVHTISQAESARAHGCTVGGYVWCYRDLDPAQTIRHAKAMGELAGIEFSQANPLWLDVETYTDGTIPGVGWIAAAETEADLLGLPIGIYTSREMWRRATGSYDNAVFSHLPLWNAWYGGEADPDSFIPYGGWTQAAGKQWTSDPIDQNVFREAAAGGDSLTQEQRTEIERIRAIFQSWSDHMTERAVQAENWGYGIDDSLSKRMAGELQGAVDGLGSVLAG